MKAHWSWNHSSPFSLYECFVYEQAGEGQWTGPLMILLLRSSCTHCDIGNRNHTCCIEHCSFSFKKLICYQNYSYLATYLTSYVVNVSLVCNYQQPENIATTAYKIIKFDFNKAVTEKKTVSERLKS